MKKQFLIYLTTAIILFTKQVSASIIYPVENHFNSRLTYTGTPELITGLVVTTDVVFIAVNDSMNIMKYNLPITMQVADTTLFSRIDCEILETVPGRDDSLIATIHLYKSQFASSTYFDASKHHFMEKDKIYFFVNELAYIDDRKIRLTVYDAENVSLYALSQNLN